MTKVRLPPLGAIERATLWLRYQRYGLLLVGATVAALTATVLAGPWWASVLVALLGIAPARFGVEVLLRWPRKLRATQVALARIQAGRFEAASIKGYCGDPCFRIVAAEILARAGMPRRERRQVIRRHGDQLRREQSMLVLFDHVRGTTITIGAFAEDAQERT